MAKTGTIAMMLMALGLTAGQAHAGLVTFLGEDLQPNKTSNVRTNSDAAAASFRLAALAVGPVGTITFESAPVGSFNNLTVAPGVSVNGVDYQGHAQTIRNATNFATNPTLDGSNTTAGGSQFVEMLGGTLTFTFAQPTQFFGAYLTGLQPAVFYRDSISFNDGTSETIAVQGTSTTLGETAFIGFVDAGKSITSITVNASAPGTGADFIGVDDVSYQLPPQVVPEPTSLVLGLLAAAPACWFARTRSRARA